MKKFIYIITGLFLLTVTSCEKEEIRPNTIEDQSDDTVVKTKEFDNNGSGSNNSKSGSNFTITTITVDSTFTITDPNRDEDDERKVKRK